MSNYSIPGYESVHNLNYWDNNEYYGFGLGAHGFISELRYENTRSFNTYLKIILDLMNWFYLKEKIWKMKLF